MEISTDLPVREPFLPTALTNPEWPTGSDISELHWYTLSMRTLPLLKNVSGKTALYASELTIL